MISWHDETDVLVAGYGMAGAVTAIVAAEEGARTTLVEKGKTPEGNTWVSLGGISCPDDAGRAKAYLQSLFERSHSVMDEELLDAYTQMSVHNLEWLKQTGKSVGVDVSFREYGKPAYPNHPGAETMHKWMTICRRKSSVNGLFYVLSNALADRGVSLFMETAAKKLLQDKNGQIIGMTLEHRGRDINVKAKKAVVLATGGFQNNDDLIRNFSRGYPIYYGGGPGNTGDGIRMAMQAGADLWHMNSISCAIGVKVPEYEVAFRFSLPSIHHDYQEGPAWFLVDQYGRRFTNEMGVDVHSWNLVLDYFDPVKEEYTRIPSYAILDENTRVKASLVNSRMGWGKKTGYRWSTDNSREIERGWIVKGDTIEVLAHMISITETNRGRMKEERLRATLETYNRYCDEKDDCEFERPSESLKPVREAPFYALPLYPRLLNTQGGPRRNADAKVLRPDGKPISRLYSAGELGSLWGLIYEGGSNLSECIVTGRIAGRNAAKEKAWN